jgi:hypothetical protein
VVDHLLAFAWRGFDGLPKDPSRLHRLRPPGRAAAPQAGPEAQAGEGAATYLPL